NALEISFGKGIQQREQDSISVLNPAQIVKSGKCKVGETGGRAAVFVNLECVGAVFVRSSADTGTMMHIILSGHGNEVARQSQGKVRVTDLVHLGQQLIHDWVGLVLRHQPVMNRNAVDPQKIIVVKPAVRAAPAGQNTGGWIVKSLEVSRF